MNKTYKFSATYDGVTYEQEYYLKVNDRNILENKIDGNCVCNPDPA